MVISRRRLLLFGAESRLQLVNAVDEPHVATAVKVESSSALIVAFVVNLAQCIQIVNRLHVIVRIAMTGSAVLAMQSELQPLRHTRKIEPLVRTGEGSNLKEEHRQPQRT
eukprot:EC125194.1.p1 GENE.EC125194.1~~EC125194.1.p1  ORF type:complete len:110 (-),score=6.27 EC125194.1:179-508(-)